MSQELQEKASDLVGGGATGGSKSADPAATGRYTALGGAKALAGTLNMVRITTVNGTDTFDAGSINILYE